jgi:hypothetical protein
MKDQIYTDEFLENPSFVSGLGQYGIYTFSRSRLESEEAKAIFKSEMTLYLIKQRSQISVGDFRNLVDNTEYIYTINRISGLGQWLGGRDYVRIGNKWVMFSSHKFGEPSLNTLLEGPFDSVQDLLMSVSIFCSSVKAYQPDDDDLFNDMPEHEPDMSRNFEY